MTLRALLLAALIVPGGFAARAEGEPAAEGGEAAGDAPVDPDLHSYPLALGGVDYAGEVRTNEDAPADLRLRRADGASMADLGYVLADLGRMACDAAGLRFDDALPPLLAADGSWQIAGACK
ncbi:hypothetical protein [Xinfangfangia pollutisoli]|uniref:hypothetical protein n=1 Tax=Xinfangfangia pollutisoli TaxID=2865960 RepID=UPI001CD3C70C|nr:hypothetical protein [Xinfangfangia pollutisoli]